MEQGKEMRSAIMQDIRFEEVEEILNSLLRENKELNMLINKKLVHLIGIEAVIAESIDNSKKEIHLGSWLSHLLKKMKVLREINIDSTNQIDRL